ncbi:uncharacterized protein LOC105275329 [Ooceraea biroi]|nr:uncharacterized protein LOC105275329 [Ooceraea biroi]
MTPYESAVKPNTTKLWEDAQTNSSLTKFFCPLEDDNVCIRYTYNYNGAIANVSYFCGKVVEDRTLPVTSGCYSQRTDGFTIEACVCQTRGNNMPCNTAIRSTCTILIIIMATAASLFIYKIL